MKKNQKTYLFIQRYLHLDNLNLLSLMDSSTGRARRQSADARQYPAEEGIE
jgi:hypothetical protein